MYNITLIAGVGANGAIGKNNQMLWHLPNDFKWFKEKTKGFNIVMGRKTMESILTLSKGKPLPFRTNIVLSSNMPDTPGFVIKHDYREILQLSESTEVMIIGGEQIYKLFLPFANKLILTEIEKDFEGDTFFPLFDKSKYSIVFKEHHFENNLNYNFVIYKKIDN